MTSFLFVYGTLMRAAEKSDLGRDMRERLGREANWLGHATVAGRLYDLGAYPALVTTDDPSDVVHGEVWQLKEPAVTFAWLDPYEGLEAGALRGEEYERGVHAVKLADGKALVADVYSYIGKVALSHPLPDGRWQPRKD